MSEPSTSQHAPEADEHQRVEQAGAVENGRSRFVRVMQSPAGRNLGLVVALILISLIGVVTAGDRFADGDNVLTILRLSAVIGVISVGMTFVIIGGGFDLSVGAIVALASVWSTTVATQTMAEDTHWIVILLVAMLVGLGCGLVNGFLVAYGRMPPFIVTLAMLVAARGLAEIISDKRSQTVDVNAFGDFFTDRMLGVSRLVWIFVIVVVIGWVLLNRTTFGRRTFAVGGNATAARLAGISVTRHTLMLYALLGLACGLAAAMLTARSGAASAQHGLFYELDAIAAVVIGGALLGGGRGSIVGTLFGVLILNMLVNIFTLHNLDTSVQNVAKGAIIVLAVFLQQRVASRDGSPP